MSTMRSDGGATFYFVQHEDSKGHWAESALDHFFFDGLSHQDSRGPVGENYRDMLGPQSASSDLWQKYGIHGFIEREDVDRVVAALRERHPDRRFRIARRTIVQYTEVIVGGTRS